MDIIKKGISSFIFNALGSSIGFILMFFAARLLGAEQFGKFNYVFGYVGSFILIFCLGSSFFLPKQIPINRNPASLLSTTVSSSFILLLIFFIPISIVFFYDSFSLFECILIFSLTLLSVVVEHAKSFNIAINKADRAAKNYNFYIRSIALFLFFILFYFFTESYLSLMIGLLFSNLILVIPFVKKYYKLSKPNILFIKGSLVFYFIQLTYSLFGYISKIFQEKFADYEAVALLSISILIGQIITLLGTNFANVGMPVFSKFYSLGEFNKLKNKFQEITRINAFIILPIFIFIFFNSKNILLIFGEEYASGDLILKLILLGSFINSIVGPNGTLLLMSGKEKLELYNGFFKLTIAVIVTLLLGPKYIWGIAFSIAFTDILVNILKSIQVYLHFRILPFNKKDFKFLSFLGIIQLIFFYLLSTNFENIYFSFIMSIIFLIINYIFSFAKSSNYDDRKIYLKFKNFLLKK